MACPAPGAGAPPLVVLNTAGPLLLWIAVLIVVIVGGFIILAAIRRWAFSGDARSGRSADLRTIDELRRDGAITEEEYRAMRRAMAARFVEDGPGDPRREGTTRPDRTV